MRPLSIPILLLAACVPADDPPPGGTLGECPEGEVADGEACVPEACGTGRWGDLPVDDATVYVDAGAADGGDGSSEAPFRTIQAGADAAGARGGGVLAVAAGSYPESLVLGSDHAGVRLAGRCRDLVALVGGTAEDAVATVDIDARYGEIGLAGVQVRDGAGFGILVRSGQVTLEDAGVSGNADVGVVVYAVSAVAPAALVARRVDIAENGGLGVTTLASGAEAVLEECTIRDTRTDGSGNFGYGIQVRDGARLEVTGCDLAGNTGAGILAIEEGTRALVTGTTLRDTAPGAAGSGFGLDAWGGAAVEVVSCDLAGNEGAGLHASDEGTAVVLGETTIRDTDGHGLDAAGGADVSLEASDVVDNSGIGVLAQDAGTRVVLDASAVRGTRASVDGTGGQGVAVTLGASLEAMAAEIAENGAVGVQVVGSGSVATLQDVILRDHEAGGGGDQGYGIIASDGASVAASGCDVAGNRKAGVLALDAETRVALVETTVRDTTPDALGQGGLGVLVYGGATLEVQDCALTGNQLLGAGASGAGTTLVLSGSRIEDTRPGTDGFGGYGMEAVEGAWVEVDGCSVSGSVTSGMAGVHEGTWVSVQDTTITGTRLGSGSQGMTAVGLAAEVGATVEASGLVVEATEGPGVYAVLGGHLSCTGCTVGDNQYAGALVHDGGSLALRSSSVSGTTESVNLGGGVGVQAAAWWDLGAPSLRVEDTTVGSHLVAGVWLAGAGSFQISGSTVSGGEGLPYGAATRCGDAVYAGAGVGAWDGAGGLALAGNVLQGAGGAGLFLDGAGAYLAGNTFTENRLDLFVQGDPCGVPEGWDGTGTSLVCPADQGGYDRPTCGDLFTLTLLSAEAEGRSGRDGQVPSAFRTASTTSSGVGNPAMVFPITFRPSTSTSYWPVLPGRISTSTPSWSFTAAAAPAARGL